MGKLTITEFITLDGVMEAPGGEPSHPHSGWVLEFMSSEQERFKLEEVLAAESQLLGRVTYETFAGAWPQRGGEFAEKMNSMPKHVVSTTLGEPLEWENSHLISGDVPDAVATLKRDSEGEILLAGSCTLARTVIEHGLVDELRLMVFPVLLGSGMRLFPEGERRHDLRLADTRAFESGVQVTSYVPA